MQIYGLESTAHDQHPLLSGLGDVGIIRRDGPTRSPITRIEKSWSWLLLATYATLKA